MAHKCKVCGEEMVYQVGEHYRNTERGLVLYRDVKQYRCPRGCSGAFFDFRDAHPVGQPERILGFIPVPRAGLNVIDPVLYLGLTLAYLCQEEPLGIPHALNLAAPYVTGATVCMGMPDTIFTPADSFAQLLRFHEEHRSDLSLGVFPTTEARSLAPVIIEPGTHRVLAIVDKPATPPVANTWGIAVWSQAFTELLRGFVYTGLGARSGELLLSDAFVAAVEAGLRVHALSFDVGEFYDIGTPEGVLRARRWLESGTGLVAGGRT